MTTQADIKFPQAGWLGARARPISRIKGLISRLRETPSADRQRASEEELEQLQQHYAKNIGRG